MTGREDLEERARSAGIATHWVGSDDRDQRVGPDTLRALLDVIGPPSEPGPVPPVVVTPVGETLRLPVVATVADTSLELDPRAAPVEAAPVPTVVGVRDAPTTIVGVDGVLPVGRHRLRLDLGVMGDATVTLLVSPPRAKRSADGRVALFVPTYSLPPNRDRPVAGLAELDHLARAVSGHGVDTIATLPLQATFCGRGREPSDPSPYSPVSRRHWNELYADLSDLPGPDGRPATEGVAPVTAMTGGRVDWAPAAGWTADVLDRAVAVPALRSTLEAWVAERPDVSSYALHRASMERAGGPPAPGRPSTDGLDHDLVAWRHVLGQYLMDEQMTSLATLWRQRGQGLALDVPVGCHPQGWESWFEREQFATGASVGAPPDAFFADGQNWGFAPLHPERSRATGHRVWHDTIASSCRHADLVRVDHVMAAHRLWWIPDGASAGEGAYVHYPSAELWADLAVTSHLSDTVIVGEDLGTVPPEVFRSRREHGVLGLYEEQFTADRPAAEHLPEIPADVVAGIRTHDMMPFRAFVTDADRVLRRSLGLAEVDTAEQRRDRVGWWRELLERELDRPIRSDHGDLLLAALERLARSAAPIVVVDLDDLLGDAEPHNVPGVPHYEAAWRKRLDDPLELIVSDPAVAPILDLVAAWRRDPASGRPHATIEEHGS